MKKSLGILVFLLLSGVIYGTEYPLNITDSYNRNVTIEKEPDKIISIAPNITEILFELGLEEKIVGISNYDNYPKKTEDVKKVGGLLDPNLETILDLDPDVILVSTHFNKKMVEKLERLDKKVIAIYGGKKFNGLYETIKRVSKVTNTQNSGEKLITKLKSEVKNIKIENKDKKKLSVYYVISFGRYGEYTAGGNTYINEMIEIAGGKNIAKDLKGWKYNMESIIKGDPYIIICSNKDGVKENLMKSSGYKELEAVKKDRVYTINQDLIDIQGPRLIKGIKQLSNIINTERALK
ncbi:MAG: ABC transporter substrate-binding protein [Fusobacteriota bacterium]